jgi:hypothetical protein
MRKETEIERVRKDKLIEEIKCDGCGHKATAFPYPKLGIWNDDGEDFETTEVNAKIIIGGYYKKYDFDVCPSCFLNKKDQRNDGT